MELHKPEELKRIYKEEFLPALDSEDGYKGWLEKYSNLISKIKSSSPEEIISQEFQTILWEDNPISGPGMCTVSMRKAIQSSDLAKWIAELSKIDLPPHGPERINKITSVYEELSEKTKAFTDRMAWLKILRLLAAIFPEDISCVVHRKKLRVVGEVLSDQLEKGMKDPILLNAKIFKKFKDVLGSCNSDPKEIAARSIFAWHLFKLADDTKNESGEEEGAAPGEEKLNFLPYERRRKGFTALSGYINTALKILDFSQDGVTRDEIVDFLHKEFPNNKTTTNKQIITVIRSELGLLKLEGNILLPNSLGKQLLDSEDPTILIPRALTKSIGFDCILYNLSKNSSLTRAELIKELQQYYPNWTSKFAPSMQMSWAKEFGLIEFKNNKDATLTDLGKDWADQIVKLHPEGLPSVPVEKKELASLEPFFEEGLTSEEEFTPPSLDEILKIFQDSHFIFPDEEICNFHVALHSHPFKHFVLLSGLSGTGKTKLAEIYANAYSKIEKTADNKFFLLLPVQPDWTDPSGLLGYINPLQGEPTYARTKFLDFILSANTHPRRPHIVCLDEMNLARVEYYFAPFLSAMETGQDIVIHNEDEPVDAVDPTIKWPENLYIIGTVNMDETTYPFSDKVLDRAFTFEFWDVDLDEFSKRFANKYPKIPQNILQETVQILKELSTILEPVKLHFGYRTAEEVLLFVKTNEETGNSVVNTSQAMDKVIHMKVLTKIRGQDSSGFRSCLQKLSKFLDSNNFKVSFKKVQTMIDELEKTGTTKFWN